MTSVDVDDRWGMTDDGTAGTPAKPKKNGQAGPPRPALALRYELRDVSGELVAVHMRREPGKKIWWTMPDGTVSHGDLSIEELPLYAIERLEERTVVLAEGEKAAEALISAGVPAVGTVTGAWATPSRTVLADLAGRGVILWPDADDEGRAHMARIGERLAGIAAWVRLVEWPDAPAKADAADLPPETIRALVDAAAAGPELPGPPVAGTAASDAAEALGIDAADLLALELPPLRWVVPDLVPEGTFVLAAPPKVGKSCLIYQIATEVALGGELFGRRVTPGSVLYLALEDGRRRGQERLRAALAGRTMPRGRLEVRWSAKRIGEGLEEQIEAWLDAHPDAALAAIDTLGRVRPRSTGKRNAYEVDVEDLGRLQSLFRDRPTALGIVHHSRKELGDDFLASVSGTYGITGSADTIIVIRRVRLEQFGSIVVTGREVAEAEVAVRFDGMTWSEAPQSIAEASFERAEVYRVIESDGPVFPAAIAKLLDLSRTSVQNMVGKLVASGAVVRTPKGYGVVDHQHEASRARAWESLPDDSSDLESHQSHEGHTRAQARAATTIACADYAGHRDAHRLVAPGIWVCDSCEVKA